MARRRNLGWSPRARISYRAMGIAHKTAGLQGDHTTGGGRNPALYRRWAAGGPSFAPGELVRISAPPLQVASGYFSQSSPTVVDPSLPPAVADGK